MILEQIFKEVKKHTGPEPVRSSANCQPSVRGSVPGREHWDRGGPGCAFRTCVSGEKLRETLLHCFPHWPLVHPQAICHCADWFSFGSLCLLFFKKTFHHLKTFPWTTHSDPATPHHCLNPGIYCYFFLSCISERLSKNHRKRTWYLTFPTTIMKKPSPKLKPELSI